MVTDLETVRDVVGGRGVDIVVDPVGGGLRMKAYDLLAPFGRLVVLGNASGHDDPLSANAAWLVTRQKLGLNLGGVAHLIPDRTAPPSRPSSSSSTATSSANQHPR
jgi:NADPH:quinone reductase